MRTFFSFLLITLFTLGLVFHEAEAKRFGGGRSFGSQRSVSSFSRTQQPLSSPMQQRGGISKWLGPLAGLAVGGLLASLFMANGLGTGLLTWLLVGGVILLVVNFIRNKMSMSTQSNHANGFRENAHNNISPFMHRQGYSAQNMASTYPPGFDSEAFLREAKVQFIRLQTAYDSKNLGDIREFTTPEVFGEIQLQLQERGDQENQTEVVNLEAELLDASVEFQVPVASVRFSGLIREERNEPAHFNEIWNFRKDMYSSRWVIAGVQQN